MSRAPKYDHRIRRKNGYMWASECDLECLEYWHGVASRPSSDPKYVERDKESAKRLSYWVQYRQAEPWERWQGVRGDSQVFAPQPLNKPTVYSWDTPKTEPAPPPVERGDAWEGDGDDPLPF